MAWLLDSGILLRYVQPRDPDYSVVRQAVRKLRARNERIVITVQNLAEFWTVCTRPASARGGYGLAPRATMQRMRLIERAFHRLQESDAAVAIWKDLLTTYSVSGVETHDARLVASMKVHGVANIVTFNTADFSRYTDVSAIHPANL